MVRYVNYGHVVKGKEEIKKIEGRMDICMDTWNKKGVTESRNPLNFKVPPAGIEPATPGLGNLKGFYLPAAQSSGIWTFQVEETRDQGRSKRAGSSI
jgi:hypothetical protein